MSKQISLSDLRDPIKGIEHIRKGLKTTVIESLLDETVSIKDILQRLHIPASTYFSRKKNHLPLDAASTEKFIRVITIIKMATDILGKTEAYSWIYRSIPSLGNETPLNLLDTEMGHRLVEQALLHIKYGMVG